MPQGPLSGNVLLEQKSVLLLNSSSLDRGPNSCATYIILDVVIVMIEGFQVDAIFGPCCHGTSLLLQQFPERFWRCSILRVFQSKADDSYRLKRIYFRAIVGR